MVMLVYETVRHNSDSTWKNTCPKQPLISSVHAIMTLNLITVTETSIKRKAAWRLLSCKVSKISLSFREKKHSAAFRYLELSQWSLYGNTLKISWRMILIHTLASWRDNNQRRKQKLKFCPAYHRNFELTGWQDDQIKLLPCWLESKSLLKTK